MRLVPLETGTQTTGLFVKTVAMAAVANFFRTALHQEPVIMWSCMIGAVGTATNCSDLARNSERVPHVNKAGPSFAGLALPLVVPPIRESFSKSTPRTPPNVKQVNESSLLLAGACTLQDCLTVFDSNCR